MTLSAYSCHHSAAHAFASRDDLRLLSAPYPQGYAGPLGEGLLPLALDLADRLLPALDTESGSPYGSINLRRGVAHIVHASVGFGLNLGPACPPPAEAASWVTGRSLLDAIDELQPQPHGSVAGLRLCVADAVQGTRLGPVAVS